MIKRGERVSLPAAELRGHIKDRRGLNSESVETANDLRREVQKALSPDGTVEELPRLAVDRRHCLGAVMNVVEVYRELRRIDRLVLPEILPGCHDLIPGLQFRHHAPRYSFLNRRTFRSNDQNLKYPHGNASLSERLPMARMI